MLHGKAHHNKSQLKLFPTVLLRAGFTPPNSDNRNKMHIFIWYRKICGEQEGWGSISIINSIWRHSYSASVCTNHFPSFTNICAPNFATKSRTFSWTRINLCKPLLWHLLSTETKLSSQPKTAQPGTQGAPSHPSAISNKSQGTHTSPQVFWDCSMCPAKLQGSG